MLDPADIGAEFAAVTGLAVSARRAGVGCVEISPADAEAETRFTVQVRLVRRRLDVEFQPGTHAGPLVEAMGRSDDMGRSLWMSQQDVLRRAGCNLLMSINGSAVDPSEDVWSERWRFLSLRMTRNLVAIEPEDEAEGLFPPRTWVGRFAALLVALLPLVEKDAAQFEPDVEGDPQLATHFRYERSARNRAAAIAIHGFDCRVCEVNLQRIYGEIARDFIHIHHLTPLSDLERPAPVDPERDLAPLCPNCHGVAHRRRPPYTIQELRAALGRG